MSKFSEILIEFIGLILLLGLLGEMAIVMESTITNFFFIIFTGIFSFIILGTQMGIWEK